MEPVLIQSLLEVKGTHKRYTIRYYNQRGEKIKEEVLAGGIRGEGICYVNYTNDRAIYSTMTSQGYYDITVKDETAKTLFSLENNKCLLTSTGIGLYVEDLDPEYPANKNTTLRVFDESGQVVGTLKGFGGINLVNIYSPTDRRYCVFEGGGSVIMLNRDGKELWRHEIDRDVISLFISKDGSHIGIVNAIKGKVLVLDEDGNLVREYTPFGIGFYWILSAFSDDGKWFVTGFRNGVKFYNNETGELMWGDTVILKENADTVKSVHIMKDADLILILCNSHNMYIFDRAGRLLLVHNLKLGKRITSRRVRDKSKPKWFPYSIKKIEVLSQNWFSDVVGEYLIINKYSDGIRLRTQGDTKIIYRIYKP